MQIPMDNKGMSLVEIVAGFVVIVIAFASFIKIINLSSEMTQSSVDTRNANNELKEYYYNGYYDSKDGVDVFTAGNTVSSIQLVEWHKSSSGDYYEEWYKNDSGIMVTKDTSTIYIPQTTIPLSNTELVIINGKIKQSTTDFLARYVYTRPVVIPVTTPQTEQTP